MPDTKSVAILFRRFKTSSRGGKGFTSLNDSEISVSACGSHLLLRDLQTQTLLPERLLFLRHLTCYPTHVPGPTP